MESNFIQAAEKAISSLQAQVNDAKASADSVAKAYSLWKRLTVVLCVVVVLLIATTILGVNLYLGQRSSTSQLRQQAISSCMAGNDRAAGTVTALDELVVLLEGPKPTPKIKAVATQYEAFVAQHNAPHNCQQAYANP